jgi:hypothetical protein
VVEAQPGRKAGVLAPHVPAAGAPVAADRDQQRGGTPPERLVHLLPGHGVPWGPFATAAATPLVGLEDSAREDRAVGLEALAGDDEAEFVEAAEGGQIGAGERVCALADGSVRQVEVFQDECVGACILGRPRRLPRDRRASTTYTVIGEELLSEGSASARTRTRSPSRTACGDDPRLR